MNVNRCDFVLKTVNFTSILKAGLHRGGKAFFLRVHFLLWISYHRKGKDLALFLRVSFIIKLKVIMDRLVYYVHG